MYPTTDFFFGLTIDRGIAKVAKKLEIDYAEAIVHPPSRRY
jgi:hypothetical protein